MCLDKSEGIEKLDIKDSETSKNLQQAFDFVTRRRTEYEIYALIAERQGNSDLSRLLTMFAEMEKEHSKLWYKWLNDGEVPDLTSCLEKALEQEREEIEGEYEAAAKKAQEEGFEHIAGLFKNIANIERIHLERLKKAIWKLKDDVEPNYDGTYNWACSVCGAIFRQVDEPNYCPLCVKENVFFYKKPND